MSMNASKVKATGGNKQAIIGVGNYPARVSQVLDLGLQPRKPYAGEAKSPCHMLWVTYELPTEFMVDKDGNLDEDKPRWISEKMNLFSLSQDNATSTKRINGLDPTGELKGDWTKVGNFPCTMTVVHSKDGKYANIGAVSPPMKGMVTGELKQAPKIFDIDDPDMDVYADLPDFLKEYMTVSNLEFKGSALDAALGGSSPQAIPEPTVAEEVETNGEAPY